MSHVDWLNQERVSLAQALIAPYRHLSFDSALTYLSNHRHSPKPLHGIESFNDHP